MSRIVIIAIATLSIFGCTFGCTGSGADTESTEVVADGHSLSITGMSDPMDSSWWAVEVRDADGRELVVTSDSIEALDSEAVQAVRETFGDELLASRTWYGCALVRCADAASAHCVTEMRVNGCY